MFLILPVLGGYLGYIALAGLVALVAGCSSNSRHEDVPPPAPPPTPTPRDQMTPPIPRAPDAEFVRPLRGTGLSVQCSNSRPIRLEDILTLSSIRNSDPGDFHIPPGLEAITIFTGNRDNVYIVDQILDAIHWPNLEVPHEILAIGEAHPLPFYNGKLPIITFTQLLPALVRRGYNRLVFEYFPSEYGAQHNLPAAYNDVLNSYPPIMRSFFQNLFSEIFATGISVYGCEGYLSEVRQLHENQRLPTPEEVTRTALNVREHALTWLDDPSFEENGAPKQPTIFYGGMLHVPSFPTIENQSAELSLALGPELLERGYTYHGVEIINPSYLMFILRFMHVPEIRQMLWYLDRNHHIPAPGRVNVVRVSSGRRTMDYIVFPYEN